jgi:hypothetical protein
MLTSSLPEAAISPSQCDQGYWSLGAFLMQQQCWCWGQDVKAGQENLLLAAGFQRTRPSAEGSCRYCLSEGDTKLYLWRFGLAYACATGHAIYINRRCIVPRWIEDAELLESVWHPWPLSKLYPPSPIRRRKQARRMLQSLLRRIARYEAGVLETYGVAYRRRNLRHRPFTAILPERMPHEWYELSWHIPDLPLEWENTKADLSWSAE